VTDAGVKELTGLKNLEWLTLRGTKVTEDGDIDTAAALFGESASRVVLSVPTDSITRVLERAAGANVPASVVGQTGGNRLRMAVAGRMVIDQTVDAAERVWSTALEQYFVRRVA